MIVPLLVRVFPIDELTPIGVRATHTAIAVHSGTERFELVLTNLSMIASGALGEDDCHTVVFDDY